MERIGPRGYGSALAAYLPGKPAVFPHDPVVIAQLERQRQERIEQARREGRPTGMRRVPA